MKKTIIILLIALNIIVQAQNPNKNKVDSTKLLANQLFDYYGGIAISRGSVQFPINPPGSGVILDSNRNLLMGLNPTICATCVGNYIFSDNVQIDNGNNNFVTGKNVVIFGANGVTANVTDGIFNPGSDYADAGGDANTIGGYASHTTGFGNINNVTQGTAEGNSNRLGRIGISNEFQDSWVRGARNIVEGNWSGTDGRFIKIVGNNIEVHGSGVLNTGQQLFVTEPGYSIGINSTIESFHIYPGSVGIPGATKIKGAFLLSQSTPVFLSPGQIAVDDNYLYVGTILGMKRILLSDINITRIGHEKGEKRPMAIFDGTGRLIGYGVQMK